MNKNVFVFLILALSIRQLTSCTKKEIKDVTGIYLAEDVSTWISVSEKEFWAEELPLVNNQHYHAVAPLSLMKSGRGKWALMQDTLRLTFNDGPILDLYVHNKDSLYLIHTHLQAADTIWLFER